MSAALRAVPLTLDHAAEAEAILGANAALPLAYLPGASHAGLVAMQLRVLHRKWAAESARVLGAWAGERLVGLAVLEDLPWDSAVLGHAAGRVSQCFVAPDADRTAVFACLLQAVVAEARTRSWAHMDLNVGVADLALAQAASATGFRLVSTNLGIVWDLLLPVPAILPGAVKIAVAGAGEADAVGALARRAPDVFSRFMLDPALAPESGPKVFGAWASNAVRGYADLVHLARVGDHVSGYCTWKLHRDAEADLGIGLVNLDLTAVAPEARQAGVLTALAHAGLTHWKAQGLRYAEVVTHVLNAGMQRACGGVLGGRTLSARHTYHWSANA